MAEHKIRFGVIGLGRIGKRHCMMIDKNPETELVAGCDIRSFTMGDYAGTPITVYGSMEEMLERHPEIDVVVVATPNGLHAEQAKYALNKGKHVVIEKPMCLSTQEAEEVIHTALNAARQVFVVKQNRYSPPVKWLKDLIEEKHLGTVHMVHIDCFWNRDERYYTGEDWHGGPLDGGSLFTQFSHFIDILYWVFGDIKNITSRMMDFNHADLTEFEDSGMVHFELVKGGAGSLNFTTSCYNQNLESSITVLGEKGTVKIGGQYMDEIEECHIKNYLMPELPPVAPSNDYGDYKGSAANHHFVIQNVVDTLVGKSSAKTNAIEGLKVVNMIQRMYEAAEK